MEYMYIMKENKHNRVWQHSFENALVRLAQGLGKRVKATENILCIYYKDIPSECLKVITYGRIVVDHRPKKNTPTPIN